MTGPSTPLATRLRLIRAMFFVAATLCLTTAVALGTWLLDWLGPTLAKDPAAVTELWGARLSTVAAGLLLLVIALGLGSPRLPAAVTRRLANPLCLRVGLLLLVTVLPLFLADQALRPLTPERVAKPKTTIFLRDEALGWRLRPGARDEWGGVEVEINAKGLRGPAIDYARSHETTRLLYLGDSVTFGYGLADPSESYPYVVEAKLMERGIEAIETVNGGVGGWSPWQHLVFLREEGLRYAPDLVILGFVLNDVTEKLNLPRFGGTHPGYQLRNSIQSWSDRLAAHSALVTFLSQARAHARFGSDLKRGADLSELIWARDLIDIPDDPRVVRAWETTLPNLEAIAALCRDNDVPLVLVAFPYDFQLRTPARSSAPQRVLARFAREQRLPYLDLLPPMSLAMKTRSLAPRDLFMDHSHPTPLGARIAGDLIAEFVLEQIQRGQRTTETRDLTLAPAR